MSIFLSAFDVHINRTPYGGRVVEVVAAARASGSPRTKHESAHLNERSEITVERQVGDELRRVHFRQIVGLMARRVVTRVVRGRRARHRPAGGADEVRLPDGRLRAARGATCSSPRATGPWPARP